MAYSITFYNVSDPPNKIKKSLGAAVGSTGACSPWEPVDDLHGSVLTNYNAAVESANYCHVTGDGRERYCYVREITKELGGQMRVHMDVDPLMTFKDEILNSDIYITRTSQSGSDYGYNMDMDDGKTPRVVYDRVTVIPDNDSGGNVRWFDADINAIYAQVLGSELDVVVTQ